MDFPVILEVHGYAFKKRNGFRVIGPFLGESTSHRGFPSQRARRKALLLSLMLT